MKTFFCLFIAPIFLLMNFTSFLCTDAFAFRCGNGIVGVGDTKSRVVIECGKPTYKERVGTKSNYSGDQTQSKGRKSSRSVEVWSYNCGEGDFIYVLTFEGGKLVKEDTNGRGRGKSDCRGR
jgi:hypothetical protein